MATGEQRPERHPHPAHPDLYVFKQPASRFYYAEWCLDGRKKRQSLKTDRLTTAFALAAEKFRAMQRATAAEDTKRRFDSISTDPTMGELFVSWHATLPVAKRPYHDTKWGAVGPFWRAVHVTDITPQMFRDYYLQRRRLTTQYGKPPSNGTLKKDAILIRLILKHAVEQGYLQQLPIIPLPGKIVANPRPWLTEEEWAQLRETSADRIAEAAIPIYDTDGQVVVAPNPRLASQRTDTDEFMRFMVDSMVRVDELRNLRFGDCRVETHPKTKQKKLLAQVTGKRGTRDIVGGADAADIYVCRLRRLKRAKGETTTALVFNGQHHRDCFRELLTEAKLRTDAFGNRRNFKALRATAISFAILEGGKNANLMIIARNAGTSLQQIDLFYAKRLTAHLWKDELGGSTRAQEWEKARSITSLRRKKS